MGKAEKIISKIAAATVFSAVALIVLPACEKGVHLKDPRIMTADFRMKAQDPEKTAGIQKNFEIDLKSVKVARLTDEEAAAEKKALEHLQSTGIYITEPQTEAQKPAESTEAKEISYRATIEFSIGASKETSRLVVLNATIVSNRSELSSGVIESDKNEPDMNWQGVCSDESCSKLYISIGFEFSDKDGKLVESKNLVIAAHSENGIVTLVKRNLFNGQNTELNTLEKQAKALESLDVNKVRLQTADLTKDIEPKDSLTGDIADKAADNKTDDK